MVEKGDFVLIELEGRDQGGRVFDSTKGEVAKKLHGKEGPLLVIYGMDRLIPGIYDALHGMKKGDKKEIHLKSTEAFGDKKKELVKIMSQNEFSKHKVNPEPGLVIHVDTDTGRLYGTVKSVNAGRVMVDFNHPIAGQEVDYAITLLELHSKPEEKAKALLSYLGLEGEARLSDEGELNLTLKRKEGQEYELHKTMALLTLKTKVPGIKKVQMKEE